MAGQGQVKRKAGDSVAQWGKRFITLARQSATLPPVPTIDEYYVKDLYVFDMELLKLTFYRATKQCSNSLTAGAAESVQLIDQPEKWVRIQCCDIAPPDRTEAQKAEIYGVISKFYLDKNFKPDEIFARDYDKVKSGKMAESAFLKAYINDILMHYNVNGGGTCRFDSAIKPTLANLCAILGVRRADEDFSPIIGNVVTFYGSTKAARYGGSSEYSFWR